MRVSSPSSSNPPPSRRISDLLVTIGTCALLLVVAVLISGGFRVRVGPVSLSVHRFRGALVAAVLAWTAAALYARAHLLASMCAIVRFIDRHATAGVVVLAAASAGVGIAYGTYAASGADAGGYVSQSELIAHGRITIDAPLAARVNWPASDWAFSPLGYRPSTRHAVIAPLYPPGLPLVMAAARLVVGEWGPLVVVPLLGFIAIVGAYVLGARLHSRVAGLIAATLLATSPIFLFQVSQPMSDVPAAAWWTVAFVGATAGTSAGAVLAGLAAGVAVLTRPNLVPLVIAVLTCAAVCPRVASGTSRARLRRVAGVVAGLIPAAATLLLLQQHLYGNPLASGYGAVSAYFSASNIRQNISGYTQRMLVGELPALVIAAVSAIVVMVRLKADTAYEIPAMREDRRPPLPRGFGGTGKPDPAYVPAVLVGLGVFAIVVFSYLPYGVFKDWYYLRFLLPAFPALFVAVGAVAAGAMARAAAPFRGLALLALLAIAGTLNLRHAAQQQAFEVRASEGRYQLAGRYLDAALPPDAVIFATQEGTSAWYYTHRPVVRWELLRVDLDTAIADIRALGFHPVLLLDDFEQRLLAERFPDSVAARLDWHPRMEVPYATTVRLYDPADRDDTRSRPTDVVSGP